MQQRPGPSTACPEEQHTPSSRSANPEALSGLSEGVIITRPGLMLDSRFSVFLNSICSVQAHPPSHACTRCSSSLSAGYASEW